MPAANSHGKRIYVFYHFYKPDDVVSAVHFADLCEGLERRGWHVTMITSNRYCRSKGSITPKSESIDGVEVVRAWRPPFAQSSNIFRIVNSLWIQFAWIRQYRRMPEPAAVIVGTDPQFSQWMLPRLKKTHPAAKLFFWSFDMYPEAIQAEQMSSFVTSMANRISSWMPRFYRPVDVMVDIGSCMRERLNKHRHAAGMKTIVPWALVEPEADLPVNQSVRQTMFGEDVELGILYSGTLGKAHEYEDFLKLARSLRDVAPRIVFAFSSHGNRIAEMQAQLTPEDTNIRFLPFASQEELEDRLNAADIHLLSLKSNWAGIVVPSKFFGSLAVGKPVLYAGAEDSCIARWIEEHNLGLFLDSENSEEVAQKLIDYSRDPDLLIQWQQSTHRTYHAKFSRERMLESWHHLLEDELDGHLPVAGET